MTPIMQIAEFLNISAPLTFRVWAHLKLWMSHHKYVSVSWKMYRFTCIRGKRRIVQRRMFECYVSCYFLVFSNLVNMIWFDEFTFLSTTHTSWTNMQLWRSSLHYHHVRSLHSDAVGFGALKEPCAAPDCLSLGATSSTPPPPPAPKQLRETRSPTGCTYMVQ